MAKAMSGLKSERPKLKGLRLFLVFIFLLFAFSAVGCSPTYPKEHVGRSIIDLCKKEYGVDVEVKIAGRTVGVYIPIHELLGSDLAISPLAVRKVDDVIMSVSRVALSTDADFNFYVVVAQDPAIPELELVIIRYVTDVKRFLVTDISRNEYFDRMITELKLTPQAEKERMIQEIFEKMGLEIPDETIEEYFKSGYIDAISDIGYWNGRFFLKDITIGEFIAKQVEERIRKDFSKEDELRPFKVDFVKGVYKEGIFNFEIEIGSRIIDTSQSIASYKLLILKPIYEVLSRVFYGYKFQDYSHITLSYDGEEAVFTKEDLDNLKRHRIKLEDII